MSSRNGLSRRRLLQFIGGGAAASAAVLIAACGDDEAPAPTPTQAAAAEPQATAMAEATPEATAAPTAAATAAPTAAPAATAAPTPTPTPRGHEGNDGGDRATRQRAAQTGTLIGENISGRNANPEVFNPFSNSMTMHTGSQQLAIESVIYINLQTGQEELWQIDGFEYDEGFNGVTMSVRDGVEWSDGMPFTAHDIAFTLNMLLNGGADLRWAVDVQEWVASADAMNDKSVHITFNKPNPRFMSQMFATLYWSVYIVPQHIWEGQDPATFTNYDPDKGWPVFTGPYTLTSTTELETVWDRNDNWWGRQGGAAHRRRGPQDAAGPAEAGAGGLRRRRERREASRQGHRQRAGHVLAHAAERLRAGQPGEPQHQGLVPRPAVRLLRPGAAAPGVQPQGPRRSTTRTCAGRSPTRLTARRSWSSPTRASPPSPTCSSRTRRPWTSSTSTPRTSLRSTPAKEFNLEKSAERMEAAGYSKNSDDLWADGDGNTVVMEIHVRGGEEDQQRVAPILADQLRVAGFDSTFKITEAGAFFDGIARGDILTNMQLVGGNTVNVADPWGTWNLLHSSHSKPIGEVATGQRSRFENAEFDAIVDAMAGLTTSDPEMKSLFYDSMEIILREMPIVSIVQTALLTPNNYTYWTNWPRHRQRLPGAFAVVGQLLPQRPDHRAHAVALA